MSNTMQPGTIVKYSKPSPGEEGFRFVVLEHNGDRVFIQDNSGEFDMPPIELVDPSEITLA
jgi:hypothetical protein